MLIDYIKEVIKKTELKPKYQSNYRIIIDGIEGNENLKYYNGSAVHNWNLSNPFFKEFVYHQYSKSGNEMKKFSIDPDIPYSFEGTSFTLRYDFILLNYNNASISPFNDDGFSFFTLLNNSIQYIGDVHALQEVLNKNQMDEREVSIVTLSPRKYQKTKSAEKSDENIEVKPEVIANTMVNKSKNMSKDARFK